MNITLLLQLLIILSYCHSANIWLSPLEHLWRACGSHRPNHSGHWLTHDSQCTTKTTIAQNNTRASSYLRNAEGSWRPKQAAQSMHKWARQVRREPCSQVPRASRASGGHVGGLSGQLSCLQGKRDQRRDFLQEGIYSNTLLHTEGKHCKVNLVTLG